MIIDISANGNELNVVLKGRLDTNTAPELESAIDGKLVCVKTLNLLLKELDYISSAGLRVLLVLHKTMTANGGNLIVNNPKDEVLEVLDMTGFSTFLTIKE
ncbi:MAG: STAS domain-containing protein [Acholeplasmatales bacterium]|nr:STAS domain-containing protein [Acholeplasmatales bacterium]